MPREIGLASMHVVWLLNMKDQIQLAKLQSDILVRVTSYENRMVLLSGFETVQRKH
jgi:hypothetical protein